MIDPGNGIHTLSREEYDALERINFSTLKFFGKSPAHYQHRMEEGDGEDTDARARGRCVHLAILEPERFKTEVVVWDGGRRSGGNWEAFLERNAGREILKPEAYAEVLAIAKAVRSSSQAAPHLVDARTEVSVLWEHVVPPLAGLPGYRIKCKARLDLVTATSLVDVKSSRDASPDGFGRAAVTYDLIVQAALYSDGYRAATGKELPYRLIAVEAAAPYVTQVYRLTDDQLEQGRETYRAWLDRLNLCRAEDRWPGYAEAEMDLVLPPWATADDENDLTELGITFSDSAAAE